MSLTDPVPPVPQHTPPVERKSGLERFTNNWMQWFLLLRDKINVINDSLVTLGLVTDPGLLAKQADGSWEARTIVGTTDRVTVSNGDGSGNPTIDIVDEGIEDIVAGMLVAGSNISLTYNDAAGTLTITASGGGGGGSFPSHDEYRSTTPISTTGSFPIDTTIPQVTEGADTGASVTLDVTDATSVIQITVSIGYISVSASNTPGFYVFRDGAANTVGGTFVSAAVGGTLGVNFTITVPAGSAGSTTFNLRYGSQGGTGATLYLLSLAGTSYHAGGNAITMTAIELPPTA